MKKRNFLIEVGFWIKLVFFAIVLFVGCVGIKALYKSYEESTELVGTTAIVKKVIIKDNKSYVSLKYKVAAAYYDDMRVENTRGLKQGDEVTIYYDPFNPFNTERISFDGPKTENIFLMILVTIPALFMAWLIVSHMRKVRAHNKLADNGMIVKALVLETTKQEDDSIFSRIAKKTVTYGLRCEAEYLGEKYYFFKRGLLEDTSMLENVYVNVYVDPNNEKNYCIVPRPVSDEMALGYNDEDISGKISTSTLSNDFDDFMKEIENK